MVKTEIRTVGGSTILFDGTVFELTEIMRVIDSATIIQQKELSSSSIISEVPRKKKNPTRITATSIIITLKDEGFFSEQRKLSAIKTALDEKGQIYPVTTLSPVVLGLVQKGVLRRIKTSAGWAYVKGGEL